MVTYKIKIGLLVFALSCSIAHKFANAQSHQPTVYEFYVSSDLEGVKIKFSDKNSKKTIAKCVTSCLIKIESSQITELKLEASKKGYKNRTINPLRGEYNEVLKSFKVDVTLSPTTKTKYENCKFSGLENYTRDTGVKPCFREFPKSGKFKNRPSGSCKMRFDISALGRTENVKVLSCSDNFYKKSSLKYVKKWRYHPKIANGVAVSALKETATLKFVNTDKHGRVIPEAKALKP